MEALHERFKETMKEIEDENEEKDYSNIKRLVAEKVFQTINVRGRTENMDTSSQGTVVEMTEIDSHA